MFTFKPPPVRLALLQQSHQRRPLPLRPPICAVDLRLHSVFSFPLLLRNGGETGSEPVCTENDLEEYLAFRARGF